MMRSTRDRLKLGKFHGTNHVTKHQSKLSGTMLLGLLAHTLAICRYDHSIIRKYQDCLDLKLSPDKRSNRIRLTPHTLTNRLRLIEPDQIACESSVCAVDIKPYSDWTRHHQIDGVKHDALGKGRCMSTLRRDRTNGN